MVIAVRGADPQNQSGVDAPELGGVCNIPVALAASTSAFSR